MVPSIQVLANQKLVADTQVAASTSQHMKLLGGVQQSGKLKLFEQRRALNTALNQVVLTFLISK